MRMPHECSVEWHRFPAVAAEPHVRAWLDLVELRGRDPKTIDAYRRGLNEFLIWLDGRSPTAVDELDAYTFIRHLQTRGKGEVLPRVVKTISISRCCGRRQWRLPPSLMSYSGVLLPE